MGSIATRQESVMHLKGGKGIEDLARDQRCGVFQMPVHYPRYTRADYEAMPEWKLDCLLAQYGLHVNGGLDHKRKFAMGAFLWSS